MLPDKPALNRAWDFKDLVLMPGAALVPSDRVTLNTTIGKHLALRLPVLGLADSGDAGIALAQQGLVGLLKGSMNFGDQVAAVRRIKRHQTTLLRDPVTIRPDTIAAEAHDLQTSHKFSALPVIDPTTQKVCGIVTRADIARAADPTAPVSTVMTTDLLTVRADATDDAVRQILQQQMVGQVLVVNEQGQLLGLRTASDFTKQANFPFASLDKHGRLLAGAVVGIGLEEQDRISALIDMGVDLLMLDQSFAWQGAVQDAITFIRRQRCEQHVTIVAGAVQNADGARALIDAGADMLFVSGHAPKGLVRTPGFTALQEVAEAAALHRTPVWLQADMAEQDILLKALAGGAGGLIGSLAGGPVAPDALNAWAQDLKQAIGQTGARTLVELPSCGRLAIIR